MQEIRPGILDNDSNNHLADVIEQIKELTEDKPPTIIPESECKPHELANRSEKEFKVSKAQLNALNTLVQKNKLQYNKLLRKELKKEFNE